MTRNSTSRSYLPAFGDVIQQLDVINSAQLTRYSELAGLAQAMTCRGVHFDEVAERWEELSVQVREAQARFDVLLPLARELRARTTSSLQLEGLNDNSAPVDLGKGHQAQPLEAQIADLAAPDISPEALDEMLRLVEQRARLFR